MDENFRNKIARTLSELRFSTVSGYEPTKEDIMYLLDDVLCEFDSAVLDNDNSGIQENLDEIHYITPEINTKTEEIDDILDEMLVIYPDFEEKIEDIKIALSEIDDKANEIYNLSC